MNISIWRYYGVTWVLSENILLWYKLLSKIIKIFELKKCRFFHQSWKNRFLLKTKSPNKKRSAYLKSALNFEFNYVPHYIPVFGVKRFKNLSKIAQKATWWVNNIILFTNTYEWTGHAMVFLFYFEKKLNLWTFRRLISLLRLLAARFYRLNRQINQDNL